MANRTPNFSQGEKEVLFEIAQKYANVLEDKKTNRSTLDQKNTIWKQIEDDFNNKAPFIAYRTSDQLKRLYENKKKDLRKKLANHKNEIYKTGGGPPPEKPKLDPTEKILIEILNEKTVSGFPAEFDSDARCVVSQAQTTEVYEFSPSAKSTEFNDEFSLSDYELDKTIGVIDDLPKISYNRENRFTPYDLECRPQTSPFHTNVVDTTNTWKKTSATHTPKSSTEKPMTQVKKENRHPPSGLEKPITEKLKQAAQTNRRRPTGGVRALTSSDVAEKYNILLDKRLVLVEKQIEQSFNLEKCLREEQEQKLKMLKQQNENLALEKEEKILKIELLKAEIKYKKSILSTNI